MVDDGIAVFEDAIKQIQRAQLPWYLKYLLFSKCHKKCFRAIYLLPARRVPLDQLFECWDKCQEKLKNLNERGLFHPLHLDVYHLFLYILYKKHCYSLLAKIVVKKK